MEPNTVDNISENDIIEIKIKEMEGEVSPDGKYYAGTYFFSGIEREIKYEEIIFNVRGYIIDESTNSLLNFTKSFDCQTAADTYFKTMKESHKLISISMTSTTYKELKSSM